MPGSPATSPRLGIPRISSADTDDVPRDLNAAVDRIDTVAGRFESGLLVSRPSTGAGIADRYYFATDDTSGGPSGTLYRDAGGATPTWQRINPANVEAAFSTYKVIKAGSVSIPTQGVGGVLGAPLWRGSNVYSIGTANGTAIDVFRLDPADFAANTRTTKLRLRATLAVNTIAPATNINMEVRPATSIVAGTSGQIPGINTVGTPLLAVPFTAPAASAYIQSDSADVNFPAATAPFAFTLTIGGGMAAGSTATIVYELQMRQV